MALPAHEHVRRWIRCRADAAALLLLAIGPPQTLAHDDTLLVSAANRAGDRLVISASDDLLRGRRAMELPPGGELFAGMWAHDALDVQALTRSDSAGGRCSLRPGFLLGVRRVRFDAGLCLFDPWSFGHILPADGTVFILPANPDGDVRMLLLVGAVAAGEWSATFQFIDLAGLHAPSAEFTLRFRTVGRPTLSATTYLCPMRCEGDRAYPSAGVCPKCGMALRDARAHQDHHPRHGGVFFMAPDGIHHLEGSLCAGGEFRIYFYDEYTQPVPASSFAARGELTDADRDHAAPISLRPIPSRAYLAAQIPRAARLPVKLKLFVDFNDRSPPVVFDFEFQTPANCDDIRLK